MAIKELRKIRFNLLRKEIKKRSPKVKIKYKANSWFWKLMPENTKKISHAFGNTIWLTAEKDYPFSTLAHEYQHIKDIEKLGKLGFSWLYCKPQSYALYLFFLAFLFLALMYGIGQGLVAIVGLALGVVFLSLGLFALRPRRAPARVNLELAAYSISLRIRKEEVIKNLPKADHFIAYSEFTKYVIDALNSWTYYKALKGERTPYVHISSLLCCDHNDFVLTFPELSHEVSELVDEIISSTSISS